MKKHRNLYIIMGTTVVVLIITAVIILKVIIPSLSVFPAIDPATLTQDQKNTLASLQKIDDHPLYVMQYYGDYSQFLNLKKKYYKQLGLPKSECTTITALNTEGDIIMSYNSDRENEPLLLLYTSPPGGYASVAIIHLKENFGFGLEKNTPLDSEQKKALLLYTPYLSATGMNEMGFAITGMSVPDGSFPSVDPGKESKFSSEMYRYLLDHAKDVADAVQILKEYNVCIPLSVEVPSHWMIADASGHSAVIEWVDGKLQVTAAGENWQVASNFQLNGAHDKMNTFLDEYQKSGKITNDINGISYFRYAAAWETLKNKDGLIDTSEAMDIMKSVSLTPSKEKKIWYGTIYSIAYNLSTGEFQIALDKKYDQVKKFSVKSIPRR